MARARRAWLPGELHHVICRFVNGEYRMEGDAERQQYLARAARSFARNDWLPLAYALMSSHLHLAFIAGLATLDSVMRGLNTGFGMWLNGRDKRGGPVFWGRPKVTIVPISHVDWLIAYVHNNPVRAEVVDSPEETNWTSHRAYIGEEPPPPWLEVSVGLGLCGLERDVAGMRAFHERVRDRRHEPRNPAFSEGAFHDLRADVRRALGVPTELGALLVEDRRLRAEVVAPGYSPIRPIWDGDLRELLAAVAGVTGVSVEEMRSRRRTLAISAARRLAVFAGTRMLGRTLTECAASVGIATSSAAGLVATVNLSDAEFMRRADAICRRLGQPGDGPR